MPNHKAILLITLCSVLFVSFVGCAAEPVADELEQSSQPIEVEDALRVATGWLQERYPEAAPDDDVQWMTETGEATASESDAAAGTSVLRASAGDWRANVSMPVTLEEYEYHLTVTHPSEGWYWEGSVHDVTGTVTEHRPLVQLTEDTALETAREFVTSSPTYLYDGIEETFELVTAREVSGRDYSWVFFFRFDSSSPGYGNRTGHTFTEVPTPHRVVVEVEKGEVVQATIDEAWDMLAQEVRAGASVGDVPLPFEGPLRPIGPPASSRVGTGSGGGGCCSCG